MVAAAYDAWIAHIGNRLKSESVDTMVQPCSTATAACWASAAVHRSRSKAREESKGRKNSKGRKAPVAFKAKPS